MSDDYRLGVDLGGTKIEAALLEPNGALVSRTRIETPQGEYQGTLKAIRDLVQEIEHKHQLAPLPLGIGVPGSPSPATGLMRNANSLCLNDMPLREDLEGILQRPVRMANDANCLALSEAVDGAAAEAGTVFGIILGTGVGGGVVIGKQLIEGQNAVAGEWGHMPLPWPQQDECPGGHCYCGRNGCLETWISGTAVEAEATRENIEIKQATDMITNASAARLLERWLDRLARSLAVVINIIDPDVIVVGGGLNRIDAIYEEVPRLLPTWVFSDVVTTRIVPAEHGDSSGIRGAARLWP
ncbi:MAG: ROK family protein [Phycisphaerales bacterium]|nr:ROK family protein [Phycisphaerales bacterium]